MGLVVVVVENEKTGGNWRRMGSWGRMLGMKNSRTELGTTPNYKGESSARLKRGVKARLTNSSRLARSSKSKRDLITD